MLTTCTSPTPKPAIAEVDDEREEGEEDAAAVHTATGGNDAAAFAAAVYAADKEADAVDQHTAFEQGQLGVNSPSKRKQTSDIWDKKMVRRLRGQDGRAAALIAQGYTHVCAMLMPDGRPCNDALKLTKEKDGGATWISTVALRHIRKAHPQSPVAVAKKEEDNSKRMEQDSTSGA